MKKWVKDIARKKQGMTIIEVLIVMALIGVLTLPMIQMLLGGQNLFVHHQNALSEKSMFIFLEEKLQEEIRFAKTIRVVSKEHLNHLEEGETALYVKSEGRGSQLIKKTYSGKEQILLDKGILDSNQITLMFRLIKEKKQVVQLDLTGINYDLETAFKLHNLSQDAIEAWEEQQGEVLIYTK